MLDPAGRPRPTSRPTPAREGGPLVVESDKDVDWYVRLGARRVSSMRSLPWAPPVIKASIPRKSRAGDDYQVMARAQPRALSLDLGGTVELLLVVAVSVIAEEVEDLIDLAS